MDDFLAFVDANSQPNGRTSHYFLSKFSKLSKFSGAFAVGEFNRVQEGESALMVLVTIG